MNKILEAIRGVVGVSGVILWEKRTQNFHKLLPARFESATIDELCALLTRYCEIRDKSFKTIARFTGGWILLHNHPAFGLMVLSKTDLNTTTLNLVSKSAISSLESRFSQPVTSDALPDGFQQIHAAALARAINLSAGFFYTHLSRFDIAELLRETKDELIAEHPALKHFSVDANGGVIVIKGAEKQMDISAAAAAARLIARFVEYACERCDAEGFNIERLTAPLNPTLSQLGFYQFFSKSRNPAL